MVARRALPSLAILLAGMLVAGCGRMLSGHGTLAEDTPHPTTSATASPSASGTGSSSGTSPTGGGLNPVCAALDKDAAAKAFGTSVSFKNSKQTGCQIVGDNGDSMIVAVFDYLTLAEYKKGSFKDLTVGGYPAVRTDSNILYVARSQDPTAEGLLAAYFSGLSGNGDDIATAMLEQLLKKYAR